MTTVPAPVVARLLPGVVLALAGGLVTGGFAAWAYYDDTWRPVAHSFGLWITLVALLSARRAGAAAVARSVVALAAAALAFYVGKKVMYGIDYPGTPYPLNTEQIAQWLVLAVVVGAVLGWAFHRIGRDGHAAAASAGAAVGLLIADAFRRGWNYRTDASVVGAVAAVGIVLVLVLAVRSVRQAGLVVLWSVPMAALGLVLVSLPDALEQLLITGHL